MNQIQRKSYPKAALVALAFAIVLSTDANAEHYHEHGWHERYYYAYPPIDFIIPLYEPYDYSETHYVPVTRSTQPAAAKPTSEELLNMKVQIELTSLSLYSGAVDGHVGPRTIAALLEYQKAKGLPETGHIDDLTLKSLGIKYSVQVTSQD